MKPHTVYRELRASSMRLRDRLPVCIPLGGLSGLASARSSRPLSVIGQAKTAFEEPARGGTMASATSLRRKIPSLGGVLILFLRIKGEGSP
jgi:hypothetical protein